MSGGCRDRTRGMSPLDSILGLHLKPEELTFANMAARTVVAMLVALAFLRIGTRRSLDSASAFDVLTGIVLGSVLSRAINGSAAFFPTLGASGVVIAIHAALAETSARWHAFGVLTKGRRVEVMRDGRPDLKALRRAGFSEEDLRESLRLHGNVEDYADVEAAYLERNGQISVVKRRR